MKVKFLALHLKNWTGVTLTCILKALDIILKEEKCHKDDEEWWKDEGSGR